MGILTGPFQGLLWLADEIRDRAEAELYDDDAVKAELTDLYRTLEAGTITEEEFDRREIELARRLSEIDERRRQRGGGHD